MLKLKILTIVALTGGDLILNSSGLTQVSPVMSSSSSRILKEARVRNKINWGLRTVSPPISFQDDYGQWQGFCTNLIALLESYLKDNQLVKNDFKIERYPIPLDKRFVYTRFTEQHKQQLQLNGECGSDSTKQKINGIQFSDPYFKTRTLFLIRKDKSKRFLDLKEKSYFQNLPKVKIGVFQSSVTGDRVTKNFENSEVDIVKLANPNAVINALSTREIDAFASNEIFLNEMLKKLNKPGSDEFYIDLQFVISRETYGLILPSDDTEWIKIINNFLVAKQTDIQNLLEKHITSQNYQKISERQTSNKEGISILLIFLCILTLMSLTYAYWVRQQNLSSRIQSNLNTLDLEHNQMVDPRAIAISFKQLAEKHPDAELEIVKAEKQGLDKFLLRAKTSTTANKSELSAEYFDTYNEIKSLPEREIKLLLEEKDNRIRSLEIFVTQALQSPKFYAEACNNQGDTMSQNSKKESNFNFQNPQFAGGLVNADKVTADRIGGNITNYTTEQKQNLAQAAAEIQQLLFQLSQTNPITDEIVTEAIRQEIRRNPTLKARLQSALKAGGLEALKAIFNHPLFSIPAETVKGWLEAE
ncbi:substrate-binding periplasmic protein [Scytonema sp. NUACC26]|uniref:substrate-binding periplasmic protein n=1 Tax=Scytonema sp. NUACC26 TaxID=3140176 RepID=UPI0034DC1098